jgi:ParB family chromosome partitioning protein
MDGFLELVAGERRWRAAQAAGLTEVPAVVRELSERDAAVFALVENLQRVDLLFLEEAEGYRELIEEFRLSQEEVAAQVGKSQPTIANKLRLLRLEVSVRECIVREGLSERHARALLRIEGEEAFASGGLTVRESEEWVEARRRDGEAGTGPAGRRSVRELSSYLKVFEDTARDLGRSGYPVDLASDEDEGGWTIRLRIGRREDASGGKRGRA